MSLRTFTQMKKTLLITLGIPFFFCHASYSTAYAAPEDLQPRSIGKTYFVSKSGNNNADGLTPATAWATMSKVNSSSFSPGDRVLFKRGDTWREQLIIRSSGSANGNITFGAYGTGDKPVIDGTGVTMSTYHGLINAYQREYIIVEDIRVQNSGIGKANKNSGIDFYGGSHITIRNCEVYKTESAGIRMNTSSNVGIFHNDVSNTNCWDASEQISLSSVNGFEVAYNKSYTNCNPSYSPPGGAGIDAKGGANNGSIHHNEVWDIAGGSNGIYVDAYSKHTYNIEIYNNYLHDIPSNAFTIGSEAGGLLENILVHHNIVHNSTHAGVMFHNQHNTSGAVRDVKIINNTFYRNGQNGVNDQGNIRIADQLIENLIIKNNIMSDNHNFQVGVHNVAGPPASEYTVDYNVLDGSQNNTGGYVAVTGTNAIKSAPQFVNSSANDFNLQSGSPAEDACDNSVWRGTPNIMDYAGVPITDGSGNIVAPGGRVNCGAYE